MKTASLLASLAFSLTAFSLMGATTIISDDFTATNVGSGFLLGEGVNSGINPPTTRLTGTVAADLYYVRKGNKLDSGYTIGATNRCNVGSGLQSGRFTIAQLPGTNAFDFGPSIGTGSASAATPVVYDINISMANKVNPTTTNDIGRMTFAFGTEEGGGGKWSFGVQIVPVVGGGTYNILKRIKPAASGLATELNASITNGLASPIAARSEVTFLIRVTDAGAESTGNYNSRVQVSVDNGATWFYDTDSDSALVNGFRFESAARFVSFDQAPNSAADTYDNFSITTVDVGNGGTLTISNNNGTANLSLQGTPGQSYVIEASPDLTTWTGVYTNTAAVDGSVQFGEVPATNPTFYRSREE